MIENVESIYKILFLAFSIIWAGNILLFRSERQIIINPVLIIIAAVLVFLPNKNIELFGIIESDEMKSTIYIAYYLLVIWGLIITRRKTDLF